MYKSGRVAFFRAFIITAMAAGSSSTLAQSSASPIKSDFTVQVSVEKGCSATPPADFDFGQQSQTPWAAKKQSNSMNVTCTKGTPYDLTFSSANDGVFGIQRYMTSSTTTSKILYYIRKDSYFAPTVDGVKVDNSIGDSTAPAGNRISDVGTGASKPHVLYVIIDQNSWTNIDRVTNISNPPSPGRYSDRVTVQVTF